MKLLEILSLSLPVFIAAGQCIAGPFGIDFSDFHPEEQGCVPVPESPGIYECYPEVIPEASSPFASYAVTWAPQAGFCNFSAVYPNYGGPRPDTEIYRAGINLILTALISKYGQPYSSLNDDRDFADWWTDVRMHWRTAPGDDFEEVAFYYYSGLDDNYPSLGTFEAGVQVSYINRQPTDCQIEASRLQNERQIQPDASTDALANSL